MAASPPTGPSGRPSLVRDASRIQESLGALIRVVQALDRHRGERFGLPPTHWQALLTLQRTGPLTVTGLADGLFLEKSTASRLAKGLLKRGLLRRRSPSSDDRKVILQVTEDGRRLARRILNELNQEYIELLGAMGSVDGQSLASDLSRLTRELVALFDRR